VARLPPGDPGAKPLGVHHETAEVLTGDAGAHNMLVTFAYVLALAGRGRERLSVLDWGGGFGHYHALARSVLPGLELDWHVKETPPVAARGRELNPEVTFSEDDSALERRYDLVVASSSVQYAEAWRALLERLAGTADPLSLAREFLLDARFSAAGAPEDPVDHRSFLFTR
jgi:putative methyltransferase (TIGR04325 family)